ncbi:MAG: magnesium transporter [Alphaproteobacteria bacterium]|nr:magnesium transporter [Alphaproteobacteria bacterium]
MTSDKHEHTLEDFIAENEHGLMDEETGLTLHPDFIDDVIAAINAEDASELRTLVEPLHAADQAELLDRLNHDQRVVLTAALKASFDSEVLPELSPEAAEDVMEALGAKASAEALAELDTDDAVHIIEDLTPEDQQLILDEMPADKRGELQSSLQFPEDSAGRLMRRTYVSVPEQWTVGNTIDYLRDSANLPENFYVIYIVDEYDMPIGRLLLGTMLHHRRDVSISSIMNTETYTVTADMDQEEVAFLFRKYALVETPVVDNDGILIGTITVDDVVDVIQEEEDEDYLRAGGVAGGDIKTRLMSTIRARFGWLFVNLLTAIAASTVISVFEGSIEQIVALAVLMPIVASMGGNAGTQSVTVAVRAIATRYLTDSNGRIFILKETLIGLINGLMLGAVMGASAGLWFGDMWLGFVMFLAAVTTLTMAGLWGALIPILIMRFKGDPAISSSIFLTTITDCVGFFSFLGLATLILL